MAEASLLSGALSTASDPWAGKMLGKYRLTRRLGQGGMGVVYEAQDSRLERSVAVKVLPEEMSEQPDALTRFLLEARSAARLNHPNVVAVYDVNKEENTSYIVMELVVGGSAQELLSKRGPFDWPEATQIIADACRGLRAAHAAGLIHRDIKPSNIMRSADGVVKLADFGLAKITNSPSAAASVTATGYIVGTPDYMSPEQCRAEELDPRSDIYSLGATYYSLLTGTSPFPGLGPLQVMFAHCSNPVPDPRAFNPHVPESVNTIIQRAMAKFSAARHASAADLLADLEAILAPEPRQAMAAPTPPKAAAILSPAEQSAEVDRRGPSRTSVADRLAAVGLTPCESLTGQPALSLASPPTPPFGQPETARVEAIVAREPTAANTLCPRCGASLNSSARLGWCLACGYCPEEKPAAPRGRANKRWRIAVAVVLLALFVGLGVHLAPMIAALHLFGFGPEAGPAPRVLMVLSPKGNNYHDYASVRKGLEKRGVRVLVASSTLEDARMDFNGQGQTAKVDVLLKDVHAADFDAVVFGGGGVLHEYTGEKPNAVLVRGLLKEMLTERKPVAGLCAGPAVLAQAGVLEGVRATCHSSVSDVLKSKGAKLVQKPGKNGELVNEPVVSVDLSENRSGSGYVVTGNGAGAAEPFCDTLVHIIKRKRETPAP